MNIQRLIMHFRELVRRVNYRGIYLEINPKPFPTCVVAGYTRSGTTYVGELLSSILDAKFVFEPLHSDAVKEVSFFHSRESAGTIEGNPKYLNALRKVFGPKYRGRCRGHRFVYRNDRVVKIVRGMFYLDIISNLYPKAKFCVVIRNPASAIASRMRQGFDVPDQSNCLVDIEDDLTPEQRRVLKTAHSVHEELALSWCLDNKVALKNIGQANFSLAHYEDVILSPYRQTKALLDFIGDEVPERRVRRELSLYRSVAPRDITRLIRGWEGLLGDRELNEIAEIVEVFGLSHLYNVKKGLPKTPSRRQS